MGILFRSRMRWQGYSLRLESPTSRLKTSSPSWPRRLGRGKTWLEDSKWLRRLSGRRYTSLQCVSCSQTQSVRNGSGYKPLLQGTRLCTPSESSYLFPSQGAAYDQARAACESLQEQIKRLQRQLAELSKRRAREVGVNTSTSHTEQSTGTGGAEVGLEGGEREISCLVLTRKLMKWIHLV